jgi:quercetin dioxygenase-like cupin family protein
MKFTNILKDITYNDDKVAITVLFETESTKEIRIAFKAGQLMKKHQTSFPITVEMVEGVLDFGVADKVHHLVKGDLVALAGGVPHDLVAKEDSIVRLTLSKKDTVSRVKAVINS